MEYLRHVDFSALAAAGPQDRITQTLLDLDSGSQKCSVNCIRTPAGGGSPAGLHTHVVDQIFYIISGLMDLEIEGQQYQAGPGSLIIFPAGVPHRNWNGSAEASIHLAIAAPSPIPGEPFAIPAP